jgi:hypothetical protein
MKKHNVIWIMIDSVRRYHTVGDDRSRLNFMDEFAKDGVEFLNCVTSAPSTLMSVSATLTSLPAYHLGRNYKDFQFDKEYFTTLLSVLRNNGYETERCFVMHPEVREKLKQFDLVPKSLWKKGSSYRDFFCNDDINEIVHSVLNFEKNIQKEKPSFWFIDYNCRKDDNISDIVKNTVESLNKAGYTKENTILMISSDHGYPDPKRGITPETLRQKKLPHDVFMTDDNIMIPLTVRYPGCVPGRKVHNTMSTLDIMPTILDILDIEVAETVKKNFHGLSLLPLINGDKDAKYSDRKIRTDARWIDQPGRLTAIRGDKYKYVFHHDDGFEEFVYIGDNDNALIEKSVINSEDPLVINELEKFRKEFLDTENNAVSAQNHYFVYKLNKEIKKELKKNNNIKLLLSGSINHELLNMIAKNLNKEFDNINIDALLINAKKSIKIIDGIANILNIEIDEDKLDFSSIDLSKLPSYNILINVSNFSDKLEKNIFKLLNKKIHYSSKVTLSARKSDQVFSSPFLRKIGNLKEHFIVMWKNREWYKTEPLLILSEPAALFRKIIGKEKPINGGWQPYKYNPRVFKK